MDLRATPEGQGVTSLQKLLLITEILATYVITRWTMPRGDIRDVVSASRARLADAPTERAQQTGASEQIAAHLGRAVDRTLRILPTDSRCLVQSLVLLRLLSARGISSTLIIGAHSRPDFAAHAWIEFAGFPVLPDQGFHDSRLLEL